LARDSAPPRALDRRGVRPKKVFSLRARAARDQNSCLPCRAPCFRKALVNALCFKASSVRADRADPFAVPENFPPVAEEDAIMIAPVASLAGKTSFGKPTKNEWR